MNKEKLIMMLLNDGGGDNKVDNECFLEVGKNYIFRTVTFIYTGRLDAISTTQYKISGAAWIADTGRWGENLLSCEFSEVEMYPSNRCVILERAGILDTVEIDTLPRQTK